MWFVLGDFDDCFLSYGSFGWMFLEKRFVVGEFGVYWLVEIFDCDGRFSEFVVYLECVNICKFSKGDGSGRYDCSILSCAWKAPRVLTGFLASTTHSLQCSSILYSKNGKRSRINSVSGLKLLQLYKI